MNSRNGLPLLVTVFLLLAAALLGDGGTRRAAGIGWRVIYPVRSPGIEAVWDGARDLLGRMKDRAWSGGREGGML